jgi:hypothetical protein
MMTLSERQEFVGGHVTPEIKQALQKSARKRKTSVSKLIHLALVDFLIRDGFDVEEERRRS